MSQEGQLRHHVDFWYFFDNHRVLFNHSDGFIRKFRTDFPQCSGLINRQRICSIWIRMCRFGEERELEFLKPAWFLRGSKALRQRIITSDQVQFLLSALMLPESWNCVPKRVDLPNYTLLQSPSTGGFSCHVWLRAPETDRALRES